MLRGIQQKRSSGKKFATNSEFPKAARNNQEPLQSLLSDHPGNQRKTLPRPLSNTKKLRSQIHFGSPKNKLDRREWFHSNNAETPSNKQAPFGGRKQVFKKKSSPQTTHFTNVVNSKTAGKIGKQRTRHPNSTRNVPWKINFFQDNVNLSHVERDSRLMESANSQNHFSIHGSSVQSQGFNVYNSYKSKHKGLLLSKGENSKSRKGEWF